MPTQTSGRSIWYKRYMPVDIEVGPDEIRRLRGSRSRAAFAATLGVNAHTVYRWELPAGSPHARRPTASMRERLLAGVAPARSGAAPAPDDGPLDAETVRALAAIERVLDADLRDGEATLLAILASPTASATARATAATGIAGIECLYRGDAQRALAAIAPALDRAATLPPTIARRIYAAAAVVHSMPNAQLFDVGRVNALTAQSELIGRGGDVPSLAAIVVLAQVNAAMVSGDDELLARALAHVEEPALATAATIPRLYLELLHSAAHVQAGQAQLAAAALERLLADPRTAACPALDARARAQLALRRLDDLGDPQAALELARDSRAIAGRHGVPPGIAMALAARTEAEALYRLGRIDDARRILDEVLAIQREHGFPVVAALWPHARFFLIGERPEELDQLAASLRAIDVPSLRGMRDGAIAAFEAMAAMSRIGDASAVLAAFARAEELCATWAFLRRDLMLFHCGAALVHGDVARATTILRRAQRLGGTAPSAWMSAHLHRLEGTLLAAQGRVSEARTMNETAVAMFEVSGDRLDGVFARVALSHVEKLDGDPAGDTRFAAAEAELATMGMTIPRFIQYGVDRMGALGTLRPVPSCSLTARRVVGAVQRLAAGGVAPPRILRELVAVIGDAFGAGAVIEELDADDRGTPVAGATGLAPTAWFDFGDGLGRRLRLGIAGPLDDEDRAVVRALATTAGLALEVASLRGLGVGAAVPDEAPAIPGVIAVSAAMRRLLGDVARLSGSRATVIVTGESGTGKEVLARAIHDRSPRGAAPYVAFNCAAVPRDLFEGQLFGYRKGAFTGAAGDHPGVIRGAAGGTVFLDEIGELPLEVQPKLLRFLENGEVFPLGSERPVQVDVRVIAATHRDLGELVRAGRFREDLYYRLEVVPLRIPPLRERRDDIPALARHFIRQLAPAGAAPILTPDAIATLTAHPWPGNVRELRNAIERALAFTPVPEALTAASFRLRR